MTTKTKGVRGRETKERAQGTLVNASPVNRLEFDLADLRALRDKLEADIQAFKTQIADNEKLIVQLEAQLVERNHEISGIEMAIAILRKHT